MNASTGETKYETKTVKAVRGFETRTRAKWEQLGWELIDQSSGVVQTTFVFRRPAPKTPWIPLAILGGAVLVLITIGVVVSALTGSGQDTDIAREPIVPEAATSPSTTPTPSELAAPPTAEMNAPTGQEMIDGFQRFVDERNDTGVLFTRGVTEIAYTDRVVQITFDPAAAGVSQEMWDSVNPFDNMATLMATPVAFNDELGNRLRPHIDAIETFHVDGSGLGTLTHSEILALNELER